MTGELNGCAVVIEKEPPEIGELRRQAKRAESDGNFVTADSLYALLSLYLRCPTLMKLAFSEEPFFVLRGQDSCAVPIMQIWAAAADVAGAPPEKITGALVHAGIMARWPVKKHPD